MIYSAIIAIFVLSSIIFEVYLIRREQSKINKMALSTKVTVFRKRFDRTTRTMIFFGIQVDSTLLVPGDIIEINPDEKVPCDLIVLDG